MPPSTTALSLPRPLQRRLEAGLRGLVQPEGTARDDFTLPAGEPALTAPDSVAWALFKNPVVLFIGGVSAVVLELAEPRVRSGVWEHTSFRQRPLARLQRTGHATMMSVYGPRSRAEALIARVRLMHERVRGHTPAGVAYCAAEPELLEWVHATAWYGFMEACHAFVRPVGRAERDRYYAEGGPVARRYGVASPPSSQAGVDALFDAWRGRLEPSEIVFEFLHIVQRMPLLPRALRPVQGVLVKAAVDVVPPWVRERLGLDARWDLSPWQRRLVGHAGRWSDRLLLRTNPAVQSCVRLGLPEDHLYAARPSTSLG